MELYEVKILDIISVSNDVFTFILEKPEGLSWEPGAHMHVGLPGFMDRDPSDKELVRHMSIVTTPQQGVIGFTTRIPESCSTFKSQLSAMEEGDRLTIFKIHSIMKLQEVDIPMVFLSMGIGMTSFYQMILQYQNLTGRKHLTSVHIAKANEHIYRDEIEARQIEGIKLLWPDNREQFKNEINQLIRADLNAIEGAKKPIYYIVGSDVFLVDMIDRLIQSGISINRIVIDKKEEKRIPFFEKYMMG